MNERIRELALEAFQPINDIASEGVADRHTFDQAWFQHYNQKFAELIVQECIDIIAPYTVRMSRPGEEYLHPILEIRKHFGVEE